MASRLDLHEVLCGILGNRNAYFQPPESEKMKYPAIRYTRKSINKLRADNTTYGTFRAYELIVIDKNPDSELIDKVLALPMCSHDRHYKSDNLNHDVFTLYF